MTEKTEWEVVDTPEQFAQREIPHFIKTLLGPWWRWKIAGTAITAAAVLMLFAALTTMLVLLALLGACVSFGIGMLRRWLPGDQVFPGRSRNADDQNCKPRKLLAESKPF